ncbi:serine/threonine protein kinase [Synechococcus sp. CC9605]|uniref:serine/threonine protein kinase n=1 Tax=Synechococcus sp. (strain CC9605) TaxID=110662 RepID=UPI00005D55D8|nr:serine/threonine protein kinase [Synechococcus sp. CC9605]ABB33892.1 serine/threonine protein kinase [Synechococcus sp. CC9605]
MSGPGTVLVERYRLEERLSGPDPLRGSLWRAVDVMAGDLPVAMRQLQLPAAKARFKEVWPQLQSLLHPQLPRCRELLEVDGDLWLLRDWQDGVSYDDLLRQKRFGPAEVLTLLRQLLPVLELLHGGGLVHGDVNPGHLMSCRCDGLPVLLDGGRLQRQGAPEEAEGWGDLHDLGHTALMLLSGSASHEEGWPEGLELDSGFRQVLERLLSDQPEHSFGQASEVLQALESVVLPASEPVPDLTVAPRARRARDREQGAEGRLWPVVGVLALSALVGSAIGWFLFPRSSTPATAPRTTPDRATQQPAVSFPQEELDQHQQLFSRLRALQVDRGWFLQLVDASQLSSESLENRSIRRVWAGMAEQWLPRIEQLAPTIRRRLGRLSDGDWQPPREALLKQGVHPRVVEHLVSAGAQDLLLVTMRGRKPADPFLQLWIAAAIQSLDDVEIVRLKARPLEPTNTSLPIPAGGARLVLVEAPAGDAVALGINGTTLMQMMVFGANGQVVKERGPLRVTRIAAEAGSPLQVLVTNEGVSSSLFTLSCRADPLDQ